MHVDFAPIGETIVQLTKDERRVGAENFETAVGIARRDFLRSAIGSGLTLAGGMGPLAFGYGGPQDMKSPVRVGIIGTGDQGGALIGALQPEYQQVTAICDIRPSSRHRALHGDWSSAVAKQIRTGLLSKYGWKTEDEARRHVHVFEDYHELLESKDIEAVIIAVPLHLHHQVALDAIAAGKHVYLETPMARTVSECKAIARAARAQQRICSIGHQRHYNVLYEFAATLLRRHTIGQVHAIHAHWHRGNLPGRDSWWPPLPGGELTSAGRSLDSISSRLRSLRSLLARTNASDTERIESLKAQIQQWTSLHEDRNIDAKHFGYQDKQVDGRLRTALEELCRWRLWDRTCGGLMNALGYNQLDAALLMLKDLQGQPAQPLSVFATGGRSIFPHESEVEDHATCVIQFAGTAYKDGESIGFRDPRTNYPTSGIPGHDEDSQKTISLVYSASNGTTPGGFGEKILGTGGTLQMQGETEGLLFKGSLSTPLTVDTKLPITQATPLISNSGKQPPEAGLVQAVGTDFPSRGYREALEHWAWCIRHPARENQPRCGPAEALRTAVLALVCSQAIRRGPLGGSVVQFQPEWFDVDNDRTPEEDLRND